MLNLIFIQSNEKKTDLLLVYSYAFEGLYFTVLGILWNRRYSLASQAGLKDFR